MFSCFLFFFFFNDTATTEIYTLSLHDALPIWLKEEISYPAPSPSSAAVHRTFLARSERFPCFKRYFSRLTTKASPALPRERFRWSRSTGSNFTTSRRSRSGISPPEAFGVGGATKTSAVTGKEGRGIG